MIICECFNSLQDIDLWSFNVFTLSEASGKKSLKFMMCDLFCKYNLQNQFKVRNFQAKHSYFYFVFFQLMAHWQGITPSVFFTIDKYAALLGGAHIPQWEMPPY